MKKSSDALRHAQDQAAVRRQLLESGGIRLIPQRSKPPVQQKDETAKVEKHDSK